MSKPSQRAQLNLFTSGFVSEANPLNFPVNASIDEENFELDRKGVRNRRLGFDLEGVGNLISLPSGTSIVDNIPITYKWTSVNGQVDLTFLVVQVDNDLYFFDMNSEELASDGYLGTVTLTNFPEGNRYSFASCDGVLIVAGGSDELGMISYNPTTETFTDEYFRLKTRDLWGVEVPDANVENDDAYRPTQFYPTHYYNLQNQSWGTPKRDTNKVLRDTILYYVNYYAGTPNNFSFPATPSQTYPSNSEEMWAALQYQAVGKEQDPFERIFPDIWAETLGAKDSVSKGYYIIDALRRGQSREEEFAFNNNTKYPVNIVKSIDLKADYTEGGPSCVCEFAGRIFYSGFSGTVIDGDNRSPNYTNYIFFSQVVKNKPDYGKCYQEGDPTSREGSDIVDTDGGFLRVAGAEKIIALLNLSSHLIVIATNGVWTIAGGSDYGFTATNYQVSRISSYGGISPYSIVENKGQAYFWSEEGIYTVARDQFGSFQVESITEKTIQTFYRDIPNLGKESSVGAYDPINKKIRWLYNTGTIFSDTSNTYELVLDLIRGSFTKNRISRSEVYEAIAPFPTLAFKSIDYLDPIFVDEDPVFSNTDEVVATGVTRISDIQTIKYLCCVKQGNDYFITFGFYRNGDFMDWKMIDGTGVDAKGYLTGGYQVVDEASLFKQIPYLTMYFVRTENEVNEDLHPITPSSCYMRMQWDWSNKYLSNRWSPLRQVYRYTKRPIVDDPTDLYDNGLEVLVTKNKVRGRGKSFAMYLETEPGKDCQIIGWSLVMNGNQYV